MRFGNRRTVASIVPFAAALCLAGCGGLVPGASLISLIGGNGSGGSGNASANVQQLAGDYTVTMVNTGAAYSVAIPGTSNNIAGNGSSYAYTGTLDSSGNLNLQIVDASANTTYTVTGTVQLDSNANVTASTSYTANNGTLGATTMARTQAIPVSGGAVNSLIASFASPAGTATATGGVAASATQNVLYTSVGPSLYTLSSTGQTSGGAVMLSGQPGLLAASADGTTVFAGGAGLDVVNVKTLSDQTVAATGGVTWLTTPLASSAGSHAYFGASDGTAHTVTAGTPPITATLPALGAGVLYGAAAVTGDNSRLLASTRGGLFAAALPSGSVSTGPFPISPVLAKFLAPVAAAPVSDVVYAVDAGQHPARLYAVDMDGPTFLAGGSAGSSTSNIVAMAISPDGTRLVLADAASPRAYVVDTSSLTVLQAIDVNVAPPASGSPAAAPQVAISRDSSRAYISGESAIAVVRLK